MYLYITSEKRAYPPSIKKSLYRLPLPPPTLLQENLKTSPFYDPSKILIPL